MSYDVLGTREIDHRKLILNRFKMNASWYELGEKC